jgi:hypothetical protein
VKTIRSTFALFLLLFNLSLMMSMDVYGSISPLYSPTVLTAGTFIFGGEVIYLQTRIQENVYRRSQDGEARYRQLLGLGYQCENRQQGFWSCMKFHQAGPQNENVEKTWAQNKSLVIRVGPLRGEPSLITEAESLTVWRVPQSITWGDFAFNDFEHARNRYGEAGWLARPPIHQSFSIHNSIKISLRLTPTTTKNNILITDYFDFIMALRDPPAN